MLPLETRLDLWLACRTLLINIRIVHTCSFLQVKTQNAIYCRTTTVLKKIDITINFKVDLFTCETEIVKI